MESRASIRASLSDKLVKVRIKICIRPARLANLKIREEIFDFVQPSPTNSPFTTSQLWAYSELSGLIGDWTSSLLMFNSSNRIH